MCTIAIATLLVEHAPIVLGANREEVYDRPAMPPGLLESVPPVFGPMDLGAGGTWLGVNAEGLLVALANRPGGPRGTRSRGWLVRDLLQYSTVVDARSHLDDEVRFKRYPGFNLVIADFSGAILITWDGSVGVEPLEPGVHVIVNEGVDGDTARSATIRARLQSPRLESVRDWEDRLKTVLRDHGIPTCVHGAEAGTRSSSLIVCREDGRVSWKFADGPPCETPYRTCIDGELSSRAS